jgi:hypothetical protein
MHRMYGSIFSLEKEKYHSWQHRQAEFGCTGSGANMNSNLQNSYLFHCLWMHMWASLKCFCTVNRRGGWKFCLNSNGSLGLYIRKKNKSVLMCKISFWIQLFLSGIKMVDNSKAYPKFKCFPAFDHCQLKLLVSPIQL